MRILLRITKKRLLTTALCLALCAVVVSALLPYTYPTPYKFRTVSENRNILIAHAGGGIDRLTYTNSREALDKALASGFEFIELDLILTCDKHIVAAHDWQYFNKISIAEDSEQCLSLDEFKNRKISQKYTVLDASSINEIFSAHTDVYLVTDKIRDYDRILQELNIPSEKLLVEVFSYKHYVKALRSGIRYPMLCIWNEKDLIKYSQHFKSGKITMITIPVELIPLTEKELTELYNREITIFAFSANDESFVKKYINKCVTGFYTDFLEPLADK